MEKNRFHTFMEEVTFDNRAIRRKRQNTEKLAALRDVWNLFVANLRTFYVPGGSLTLDEQLYGYRDYAPDRAYICL